MAILKDEILDDFISELREKAIAEFKEQRKEVQARYDRVRELSVKSFGALSQLNEETKHAIEDYMEEKDSLTCDELDYVYLKGMMDGCKLLKLLKII